MEKRLAGKPFLIFCVCESTPQEYSKPLIIDCDMCDYTDIQLHYRTLNHHKQAVDTSYKCI